MKLEESLFKFPKHLPNDLEGFMFFYPNKFPKIIAYYEEIAAKVANDSKAYREYGNFAHDELFKGFKKINDDYEKGDRSNLEFLVSIDQRLHKLFCFRFWIVNYLFVDGPLQDYFVDNLVKLIRKFVEITGDIEEYETNVATVQRDLLQGDYADLYMRQALDGVELMKILGRDQRTKSLVDEAITLISKQSHESSKELNDIWNRVIEIAKNDKDSEIIKKLAIPIEQAEFRKTMSPVYNMLTHAVEFRDENIKLAQRQGGMGNTIEEIREKAKGKLTAEEFELFELSYKQAANFAKYKDVMGEIDPQLLPMWFGLHDKIKNILVKTTDIKPRPTGHAAMFYLLVWYLPMELKTMVFTPDMIDFSIEKL